MEEEERRIRRRRDGRVGWDGGGKGEKRDFWPTVKGRKEALCATLLCRRATMLNKGLVGWFPTLVTKSSRSPPKDVRAVRQRFIQVFQNLRNQCVRACSPKWPDDPDYPQYFILFQLQSDVNHQTCFHKPLLQRSSRQTGHVNQLDQTDQKIGAPTRQAPVWKRLWRGKHVSHNSLVIFSFLSAAICLPGCDEEHGFCEKPGECK